MARLTQRLKSNGHGQVMVEFALVFPILLLITLGVMDLARAVYAYGVISNAARDGAHWGSLNPRNPADGKFYNDQIIQKAAEKTTALNLDNITIGVGCTVNPEPDHPRDETNPCTSWNWVTVTITYEFQPITLFFSSIGMYTESTMTIE